MEKYYDRQFNNWLHKYTYKKKYPNVLGQTLRSYYEDGKITTESKFKEVACKCVIWLRKRLIKLEVLRCKRRMESSFPSLRMS